MEERHKKILQRSRVKLVTSLDPSDIFDILLSKGIFTQDMIDEIKSSGTRRDQVRQLVRDLETRGSQAFPAFIEILFETGQQNLADLLLAGDPQIRPLPIQPRPPVRPMPVDVPMDIKKPVDVYPTPSISLTPTPPGFPTQLDRPKTLIPSPSPDMDIGQPRSKERRDSILSYKMDASPCGHCLIINNVDFETKELRNRTGSNIDCDKLERRFKFLNFIVLVKKNLTVKQMLKELSALSKMDHSQFDCCVVIMLSHGTEVSHMRFPGGVHGVDGGASLPVQNITNYLDGKKCPSLQGKPKLFFIQACGGENKDKGFEVPPGEGRCNMGGSDDESDAVPFSSSSDSLSTPSDEPDAKATLPTPCDILVSYSTFPGYVSWRDPKTGSWYIETLDRILEEHADTLDLTTMLMMVNNEVSQNSAKGLYKQMPGSFNFLRKHLYFQAQSNRGHIRS